MTSLEYRFCECLFVTGNHEAGELNGVAFIDYSPDGSWSVEGIYLDHWDCNARKFNSLYPVPNDSEVYGILHQRLTTGKTRTFIQSEVDEALADGRESAPFSRADHMRKIRAAEVA